MDPGELPERICGLRVVRTVASGNRARVVLLQHPDGVLARVWHGHLPRVDIDRELAAMTRAAHPHLLRPLDVETFEDGRVAALVRRVGRGSVQRLLEARHGISYGEAVTLGAPIASAVEALHAAGVRHGGIGARRILLTDAGAPVLVGFGRAELFDRGLSAAARVDRVGEDLRDLRGLLEALLSRVDPADARAARTRSALRDVPDVDLPAVADRVLFEAGGAAPVLFPDSRDARSATPTGRVGLPAGAASTAPTPGAVTPEGITRILRTLDRGGAGIGATLRERWTALPRVRRLAAVGGGAAVATALCAAVLVPGGSSEPGVRAATAPSATPTSRFPTPTPTSSASSAPDPSGLEGDPGSAAVRGSDPLAASAVLLSAREACIRDGDAHGLAEIDEAGSALLAADLEALGGRGGPVLPEPPYALVQTLGDAALVASPTTRILLVDTTRGWRLRDVSAADPEDGG